MKKIFLILSLFVLVGIVLWLALPNVSPPLQERGKSQQITKTSTRQPQIKLPRVEPLEPWQSDDALPKTIPETLQGATDDPSVVELLTSYQKIEIGKIVATENGTQQLWDGSRLLFEAKRIGDRSKSADGTIALDAVTGDRTPIEDAEVVGTGDKARLVSSPREVWFVTPSGDKKKVSPPNMDAFAPVIDPSGKFVAFTGRLLDERGFPSSERLYVGDAASGQYRVFEGDEHLHDYQVWAVDWVKNGSVLRVLQDHGETGGHMKLKQVHIQK